MERIGLAPGSEIGGYTVVAPLGSGGMGTVYRALDGGGSPVALKLLHPQVGADATARARLLREVAALQKLRHPAVAAVLDAEADSTEAFLVTELVDGPDLEGLVRERGPLDADALLSLATGLRDALAAVHAAGVVHRDLKPSNVLMTDHGPVLIDFGLAQGAEDARVTSTGLVAGTPGYLAPELLDGAEPGESADWWGWAAVLAFAATGRPPFGGGRVTTVLVRARTGKPDLVGLGRLTRTAIRGGLAPEPADRTAPDDVVAALTVVAAEGDVMPRRRSPGGGADDEAASGGVDDEAARAGAATAVLAGAATAVLAGADAMGTTVLTGPDAAGTRLVPAPGRDGDPAPTVVAPPAVPPAVPPSHDGRTVAVPAGLVGAAGTLPPAFAPPGAAASGAPLGGRYDEGYGGPTGAGYAGYDDPDDDWGAEDEYWEDDPQYAAVGWIEDDLDASAGEAREGSGYERPPVPGRWMTQLALAAVVAAAGANRPGLTLVVVVAFFLLARGFGSTVEAMHGRREKRGVRRADGWVAALTAPWHLLRAVVGMVPALLVAGSALVIGVGVAWWFVRGGRWTIGDNGPGDELAGTTASWLVGLAVLLAALLLWFGPLSRMTRVGARRLAELVSPGRLGAFVLVVLLLVAAVWLAVRVLHGGAIGWWPLPAPTVPVPQP